jgi:hypothetical protein
MVYGGLPQQFISLIITKPEKIAPIPSQDLMIAFPQKGPPRFMEKPSVTNVENPPCM